LTGGARSDLTAIIGMWSAVLPHVRPERHARAAGGYPIPGSSRLYPGNMVLDTRHTSCAPHPQSV